MALAELDSGVFNWIMNYANVIINITIRVIALCDVNFLPEITNRHATHDSIALPMYIAMVPNNGMQLKQVGN